MDLSRAGEEMIPQAARWCPPHSGASCQEGIGEIFLSHNASPWSASGLPCLERSAQVPVKNLFIFPGVWWRPSNIHAA